jgi:hypothetical protein
MLITLAISEFLVTHCGSRPEVGAMNRENPEIRIA